MDDIIGSIDRALVIIIGLITMIISATVVVVVEAEYSPSLSIPDDDHRQFLFSPSYDKFKLPNIS